MTGPARLGQWKWSCAVCGHVLPEVTWGRRLCPACGCPFTIKEVRGKLVCTGVEAVPLEWLRSARDGTCAGCDQLPSGVCDRCGAFLCPPCFRFLEGRRDCAACARSVRDQRNEQRKRAGYWIGGAVIVTYLFPYLV